MRLFIRRFKLLFCLFLLSSSACGVSSSPPALCAPINQTILFDSPLLPWTPSQAFTVAPGQKVWLKLTKFPTTDNGLLGGLGSFADLYTIPTGHSPSLSNSLTGTRQSSDPKVGLSKSGNWQYLGLKQGNWQVYSDTNPYVRIMSCPG